MQDWSERVYWFLALFVVIALWQCDVVRHRREHDETRRILHDNGRMVSKLKVMEQRFWDNMDPPQNDPDWDANQREKE